MFELHTWGPAFNLPSIDVECLAAILYLQKVLPLDSWTLIPSSNPDSNPYRQLPALRHGSNWTAGFQPIQEYLIKHVGASGDLDRHLDKEQTADRDAFTSFIHSKCLPLLDLSLYVSSDNYHGCTRRVLGDLLAWPQSWTVPNHLRECARKRSEHLGLSALDVDTAQEEDHANTTISAQIPKSLQKPRRTIGALLGTSTPKTQFRLDAVIATVLEPLDTRLSGSDWLIADEMTSLDCLVIAVISLMQITELPHAWLHDALSKKHAGLVTWARKHASTAFGIPTTITLVMKRQVDRAVLPWTAPSPSSWAETVALTMESVVSWTPLFRPWLEHSESLEQSFDPQNGSLHSQLIYTKRYDRQRLYSQAVVAAVGAASLCGWLIHGGLMFRSRSQSSRPSRRNFGEAGQILGL